jgi:hypothetical protein
MPQIQINSLNQNNMTPGTSAKLNNESLDLTHCGHISLIYGLFNDALNIADYIVSNESTISEL